jgi:hypothetical protein
VSISVKTKVKHARRGLSRRFVADRKLTFIIVGSRIRETASEAKKAMIEIRNMNET